MIRIVVIHLHPSPILDREIGSKYERRGHDCFVSNTGNLPLSFVSWMLKILCCYFHRRRLHNNNNTNNVIPDNRTAAAILGVGTLLYSLSLCETIEYHIVVT